VDTIKYDRDGGAKEEEKPKAAHRRGMLNHYIALIQQLKIFHRRKFRGVDTSIWLAHA
jgi:hypothetical protein